MTDFLAWVLAMLIICAVFMPEETGKAVAHLVLSFEQTYQAGGPKK